MSKAQFIRAWVIRLAPALDRVEAAIEHGERIWEVLTRLGYGAPLAEPKRRARVDWYGRLSEAQRAAFDRFWRLYDHKKGKSEAAMVWGQIDPPEDELEWIYASAAREAKLWRENPPQGQTRIYAQGWLSGFRWRDHPRPDPLERGQEHGAAEPDAVRKSRLLNTLKQYKDLYSRAPNETLARQISELEAQINGR